MTLSLRDLDFEANDPSSLQEKELKDALEEIRGARSSLGKMSLRDTMEAVYGTAYTNQVLGEDVGDDILMEEMTALDDIREANGRDRRDVGGNRLPKKELTSEERQKAREVLSEQEKVTDEAVKESLENWFREDAKLFRNDTRDYEQAIRERYPEQAEEIIRLVNESQGK